MRQRSDRDAAGAGAGVLHGVVGEVLVTGAGGDGADVGDRVAVRHRPTGEQVA